MKTWLLHLLAILGISSGIKRQNNGGYRNGGSIDLFI